MQSSTIERRLRLESDQLYLTVCSEMLGDLLNLHFLIRPSIFPSIRVFSNELALLIRWPKYRSFSFSISPSNRYSGLTSFRIDWFDLFAVQGTLEEFQE